MMQKRDGFKDEKHIVFPLDNQSELLAHPLIYGSYITEIGLYPSAQYHYRERFEGTPENILIYCIEGEGIIELLNKETIQLKNGEIFCIPAKTPHRYYTKGDHPWSILWIHFVSDITTNIGNVAKKKVKINLPAKKSLIQNHFIDLLDVSEKEHHLHHIIAASKLLELLLVEIYLLEDKVSYDKQNQYLTKCIRYMNENIEKELTLNDLTYQLNISQSYLSSIFKKYTQTSPIEYFIQLKIDQACKFMKLTDMKIYEIAKKVGYEDPYYFSRLFKKYMGLSPKVYRKQVSVQEPSLMRQEFHFK